MKQVNQVNQTRKIEYAIAIIVLLFCEWFFFRNLFTDGAMLGDRGDGRLTMLLTEHWWNFFCGKEHFSELAMFYPVKEAIGYTDLFLGYGLIHSLFRLIGLDMFIAYKWTLITVHIMGTVSMYYLMNKKLRCNTWWSLFGTMAFCFSDTFARHLCHTQLDAVSALPILLILFLGFIENYDSRKKRNIYAYGFLAWFVLLTYNSWYIACFTGVFALVFLIVYAIRLKLNRERIVPFLRKYVFSIWKDILCYLLFTIILYIPFIKIYIPVMRASSGYSYPSCAPYLPEFADIFNVSTQNFMLGKVIEKTMLSMRGYSGEVEEGFSIILLGLFVFLFVIEQRKNHLAVDRYLRKKRDNLFSLLIPSTVCITVITCIALILRLSAQGLSLWIAVYYLLPVVRSMRAVARFLLWLSFPMAVITAYCANKYIGSVKANKRALLSFLAVVLLFVSNIDRIGVYQYWSHYDEAAFISSVSAPPEDAEVFYIVDSANVQDPAYIYQLDAYEIAQTYSIKTINGYSGQLPDGWWGIWELSADTYEDSALQWVQEHGLSNVYAYDRATDTWISVA